jgi:MarR family transcriptional regulator for hemolysin
MATKRTQRSHRESMMMSLGVSIPVLERSYRALANQAVAHVGLSQALAWPLVMIGRHGDGMRQGALADRLNIEGPSLARSMDQLQQMGFIDRREDPIDRRAKTLHLTASGAEAAAKIEDALSAMRAVLYQDISDTDLEVCLRVFGQLRERMGCAPVPEEAAK